MINAIIRCVLKLWNLYAYSYLKISTSFALIGSLTLLSPQYADDLVQIKKFCLSPITPAHLARLVVLFVFYVIPLVVGLIQLFLIAKYIIIYNFDLFDLFDFLHEEIKRDNKFIRIIIKWPEDAIQGYVLLGFVGVTVGSINFPAFKEIGEIILTCTGVSFLFGLIGNAYVLVTYVLAVMIIKLSYLLIKYLLTCLLKLLKIIQ